MEKIFVSVVFVVTYLLIIQGKFKRSIVAFAAGMIIILSKVIESFNTTDVGQYIDFNTIGLLIGMMIIIAILRTTGFFEYVAILVVRLSKGNIRLLFYFFMVTIAVFSAFLDNVTTILLFSPILFLVADSLGVSPVSFLIMGVISANVGGTATLIGDPPNILIGSASGNGFLDFIINLGPLVLVTLGILLLYMDLTVFRKYSGLSRKLKKLSAVDASKVIKSQKELYKSLGIFVAVIVGFILHETLDYETASIALTGAAISMLLSQKSVGELSRDIEWDTIFFFMGLFMVASALQEVGITDLTSSSIAGLYNHPLTIFMVMLWLTAIMSAIIGAVPTVTVMIPIVKSLIATHGFPADIWWVLSIGACFGGNATLTGAAANMVGAALVEKHTRKKFGYLNYLKLSIIPTMISLGLGTIYVLVQLSMGGM